jgi:hypothetical protein
MRGLALLTMKESPGYVAALRLPLREPGAGILALPSGGCARYILSTVVQYTWDARGRPVFACDRSNPEQTQLLEHSTLSLRIDVEKNPDGSDRMHLLLIGRMEPQDERYFVLNVDRAQLVHETGEVRTLDWALLRGHHTD